MELEEPIATSTAVADEGLADDVPVADVPFDEARRHAEPPRTLTTDDPSPVMLRERNIPPAQAPVVAPAANRRTARGAALKLRRALVVSGSPDHLNANAGLRPYVVEGLREALPEAMALGVPYELGVAAVAQWQPQLVIVFGSVIMDTSDFAALAQVCRRHGIRLVFWLHDDPYEFDMNERVYPYADAIFSNDLAAVDHYPPQVPVFHLPLAGSRLAHWRALGPRSAPGLFFCGHAFENRQVFFAALCDADPAAALHMQIFGTGWNPRRVPGAIGQTLPNAALPDYYASAVAVANLGRDLNLANRRFSIKASTPGPRSFEAAVAGAAQIVLTDSLEIVEYFEPGREVLLAHDVESFHAHWQMLLADAAASQRIGERAQRRALSDHTYACRARTLLQAVQSL